MANLSANQIWKKYGTDKPFNFWINDENKNFLHKQELGKIAPDADFRTWLNKRYEFKARMSESKAKSEMNADGNILDKLSNITSTIKNAIVSDSKDPALIAQNQQSELAKMDKRIFGLQPIAFYSITGILVLGVVYVGYKIYKKSKE